MGPDLMESMRAQAERFGAQLVRDDVTEVSLSGPVKSVTDGSGTTWWARTVILAMGSAYRQMGIADEKRLSGHGCPGARPVTGSSSAARTSWSSAAETPPWRKPPS